MAIRKRKDSVQATEFIHCLLAFNLRRPSVHSNSMYKNTFLCLLTMRAFEFKLQTRNPRDFCPQEYYF